MISHFAKNPGPDDFSAIDQILRYLAKSPERDFIFGGKFELNLVEYSDFD